MKTMEIPILFVIFKRLEIASLAFERIRKVRPKKLYIACDGAREWVEGEQDLVCKTRESILNMIDWDCDVQTNFQKNNLGCALGVYTAINWLFEHESCGIILEDDCVVQDSFFPFMAELLDRFQNDERIGMIDGANYLNKINIPYSYCFSRYKSTNGWGTWRRAWANMDMQMNWRNTSYENSIIANMGYKGRDIKYWKYKFKIIDNAYASAWDWQWYYTLSAQNQLSVFPKHSLVSNVGFGQGATHTTNRKAPSYYHTDKEIKLPLQHPPYVVPFIPFEKAFYKQNNTMFYILMRYVPFWLKRYVKKLIR